MRTQDDTVKSRLTRKHKDFHEHEAATVQAEFYLSMNIRTDMIPPSLPSDTYLSNTPLNNESIIPTHS